MKKIFILLALLVAALDSCKKSDDTAREPDLPPLTQEGKNVLACRVNGAVHIYSGKHTFGSENGVQYSRSDDKVVLYADEDNIHDDAIRISIYEVPSSLEPGILYQFSSESNQHSARYYSNAANPYFITKGGSGWMKFTRVDSAVAAGTFEFTAYFGSDSVKITEGRFDIAR